jgi:hypothetical protein
MNSPDTNTNVYLAVMEAVVNSSSSISNMQKVDSETTINAGKMENAINQFWYNPIAAASDNSQNPLWANIQYCITALANAAAAGGNNQGPIATWQSQFQKASALAQSATSNADSVMQMSNSQASADATNIQQINQLGTTLNIMGFIAQLIAK